ncbi:MAG: MFS transporter [Erysipelotrichaceae bacterium]|nr:MFS transporter [Erysipelotrichaceae bacterium]
MKKQYQLYILNFLSFFIIALVNTQWIPFLTNLGYSIVERGYIFALNAVIAMIGQSIFGYLCDRYHKIKPFFFIAYLFFIISSLCMFLKEEQVFYYHLFSVSISGGMIKVIMGLEETWMLQIDEEHYGKLRAWGAIGLTVGAFFASIIVKIGSYIALMIVLIILSFLLAYFVLLTREIKTKAQERMVLSNIKELMCNKKYWILILIFLFIYMIGTADQYVVIDKMLAIGASNEMVGMKWAIQSLMEVPCLLLASKLLARFQPFTLLVFGTIMYAIKFILYASASNSWVIVMAAALQVVTLPIIMLTSKIFIKEVAPTSLYATAQMLAMALFMGVSGIITPLFTAYVSHSIGYNATLYIIASLAILPLSFLFWYQKLNSK